MSSISNLAATRFADADFGTLDELKPAAIVILGVPADSPAPQRSGTAAGPLGLREASHAVLQPYLSSRSRTVTDIESGRKTRLRCDRAVLDIGDLLACNPWTSTVSQTVAKLVGEIVSQEAMPLLLGGDSRVVEALLDGLTIGGDAPACIVLSNKLIPVPNASNAYLFVGINGLQPATQWKTCRDAGGIVLSAEHIHVNGIEAAIDTIDAYIFKNERLAVCLDLEILDSGYAAGTPGINVGGLTPEQLTVMLSGIDLADKLAGIAAVNVAPALDPRGLTEFAAMEALLAILDTQLFEDVST